MTSNVDQALVVSDFTHGVYRITLNRPARRNSLTPELLEALHTHLDALADIDPIALIIQGAGKSFSSGGDVKEFATQAPSDLEAYADNLVCLLNDAILKILAAPIPVINRLQGFVTGGSVGMTLASDIVVMADDAYIAPFYTVVGFSPDGGWTALLPEIIGSTRALEMQILNRRIHAGEALRLGLATHTAPSQLLNEEIDHILDCIAEKSASSIAATKRLVWSAKKRKHVAARLDAERESFVRQISREDTAARMAQFIAG